MDGEGMSKTDGVKIGAVVAFMGVGLFFALRRGNPYPVEVGEYAPDFTLPVLVGGSPAPNPIHLYEHRGHVVLVNFWASWCPPCVEETPSLEKLSAQLQPMGVEVIAVSVDQDPAALAKFIANYHLSFPVALDPDQTVASTYGTSVFPETYILDRQGRVAEKIIGGRDWEVPLMVSFVDSLARGGGSPKQ
jgi:cytochrome c biogenesis protein CcmG/thiol:disulfide interchange protein DsbE